MELLVVLPSLYVGALIAVNLSYLTTTFIRPKGLWNLVPFRVSGWKSPISGKVYNIK